MSLRGGGRFDILDLRESMIKELACRRITWETGDFRHHRDDNSVPLYGCTGAANVYGVLGLDFGDFQEKQAWACRINTFQMDDGSFTSPSGLAHAADTAISTLNILGFSPRYPVRNLAPVSSKNLLCWLKSLNWESTHKDFCCAVAPVLASGVYDSEWISTLHRFVDKMINPRKPLETWCSPAAEPWRVISCIYHITSGYDAAFLPYPHPELLWQRLRDLNYEKKRNDIFRTVCTDFDFVRILQRLTHQLPEHFEEFLLICKDLFIKRHQEWHEDKESLFEQYSTHDLFCYLIGWAVLQPLLPEYFTGPALYDTQNAPWLKRLPLTGFAEI